MQLNTYIGEDFDGLVLMPAVGVPIPIITVRPRGVTYWIEFRWSDDTWGPVHAHDMTSGDGASYLWAEQVDSEDAHPLDVTFPYTTAEDQAVVHFQVVAGLLEELPPGPHLDRVICRYCGPQPEES